MLRPRVAKAHADAVEIRIEILTDGNQRRKRADRPREQRHVLVRLIITRIVADVMNVAVPPIGINLDVAVIVWEDQRHIIRDEPPARERHNGRCAVEGRNPLVAATQVA